MSRAISWLVTVPRSTRLTTVVVAALIALGAAGAVHPADAGPRARRAKVVAQAGAATRERTDAAMAKVKRGEQERARLLAARGKLDKQYQAELAEIDKLKRQKASWRRDRALRSKLTASQATANKLSKASRELIILDAQLYKDRKAMIAAIDKELAAGGAGRKAALTKARAAAARAIAPAKKAKKIVIPDDEIDPLADPEELEAQARALRDSEAELARQIASLERQAARFRKQAELRKQHERADELASRDGEQPRRTTGGSGARGDAETAADDEGAPAPQDGDADDGLSDPSSGGGEFEGDPAVVLSDVVDADTVDALRKAERSSDPSTKAAAAERARAKVQQRLDALKKRRQEIEQRARELAE